MPNVAIVGAGLIGRSWAIVFARAGWQVRVTDPEPRTLENASRLIREGLDDLARHGLVTDLALHGRAPGSRPLPGRPSGESSPSAAARGALRRSLDNSRDDRAGAQDL